MVFNSLAFGLGPMETISVLIVLSPVVCALPLFFYLRTLRNTLSHCTNDNPSLDNDISWQLFVPIIGPFYHFIVVANMSASLVHEFDRRQIAVDPRSCRILGYLATLFLIISAWPGYGIITILPALSCWIIYWVMISDHSKRLIASS